MKKLSSAIHRGEYLINYPYSSMEKNVVLRLNIACSHSEDLDCNVTSNTIPVANLAPRFSLETFIPGFGWWCEQLGLLNKSWFLSHASVVWKHVAERLWHCSVWSQICLVVSVVVLLSGIVCRGASAHFMGHVEAKCMLWAKQAGYKGVFQNSLESKGSSKCFRDCG